MLEVFDTVGILELWDHDIGHHCFSFSSNKTTHPAVPPHLPSSELTPTRGDHSRSWRSMITLRVLVCNVVSIRSMARLTVADMAYTFATYFNGTLTVSLE